MVSPGVIAGFAVIEASVLGQILYAARSYERHHQDDAEPHVVRHHRRTAPNRRRGHSS
ncbi:MAG: hypothetical protein JSU06_01415 [Actinobacteria bacterium]|nr:hypothetical protein [Actinomycetota bacterium]